MRVLFLIILEIKARKKRIKAQTGKKKKRKEKYLTKRAAIDYNPDAGITPKISQMWYRKI